ncbi:MAG: pyridoxal-phosphate dependent enzyme [Acidobacteria bacterium]|nr:pyridoxal-phosphate dependent enzyme [Acidobacteriota bacterium]
MPSFKSLGEGNTPLVQSISGSSFGELWFKLENCNPSGSYKDRFIAAEMRRLVQRGAKACLATSSGNTGSSLAAYSARFGIKCLIVVNADAPTGKLAQMLAHGAHVLRVPGFVSDANISTTVFDVLRSLSSTYSVPLVVSAFRVCPEGMRGVETIAAELLAHKPDHIFVPVGGGGLYSAVVQGFLNHKQPSPRVHAVQPEGCLTLVAGYLNNSTDIQCVQSTTRISGLSVPNDLDASRGLRLLRQCNGTGIPVSDDDVFAAQKLLAHEEGIYCEPAGATAFAGWRRAVKQGIVGESERSICLVTGHGFKDPDSIERLAESNPSLIIEAPKLAETIIRLLS